MSKTPYFPPLYREVDCGQCEIAAKCRNYGKSQRNRRDFSVLSGRCPRLPDKRGFVDKRDRELYATVFPLVHAERGDEEEEDLELTLRLPGEKRNRKVYQTKSGYWYYNITGQDGRAERQVLYLEGYPSKEKILEHMKRLRTDYCILRCEMEGKQYEKRCD